MENKATMYRFTVISHCRLRYGDWIVIEVDSIGIDVDDVLGVSG